jgi:hypothetical protein
MENLSLCPGSFSAQKDIAEEQMSFDAMAGIRIHSYLEGVQDMVLNVQEQDIADELEMKRETVIAEIFPKQGKKPPTVMKEHRLWLSPPAMAAPINFSGMADHIVIQSSTALIADYKTGRGEVTPSSRNLQLLALAVLLKENFPKVRKVHTAILQTREEVEVATFTAKQLKEGKELLLSILELALTPSARRFAGEKQCKWCKYKTSCPEAMGAMLTLVQVTELTDPSRFSELLDYVGVAKKLIPEIEKRAKEELEKNPEAIPGYKIMPGRRRRKITDSQEAFNRLREDKLISPEEFLKAVKISVRQLEAGVCATTGKKKGEAFNAVADSLEGLIQLTQDQPRLTKE